MKNTKNGVEAFVDERGKKDKKKNPAMMPSSHPTAPVEQMPNSDVSHSQGSDNIIAYIKEQLNPSEQTKILYQSAVTAGAETSAEIPDAQKEWKEKGTDSKYFQKWLGDSKVVDENGYDTVLHSEKEHTLTSNEWKDLLSNIDNIESAVKSHQRPRYSGIPVLLKVKTNNGCYGVVLEIFQKNNPIITTAFTDVESEIDNWIKVEAIPNGTETTFSDTRLNNIITHFAPNFNQFQK